MSPPPRPVTATTQPPPEDATSRLARVLTNWKTIAMAGAVLCGLGAAVVRWDMGLATVPELERITAGVSKQAGAIERRVDHLELGERWRDAALKGIAEKLGVFVPDPPPLAP